jgi:hypothetical protein
MKKIVVMLLLTAIASGISASQVEAISNPAVSKAVFPSFVIKAVDRDDLVTVQTANLGPYDSYVVTMGPMWTRGVDGYHAATIQTGSSGALTKTFKIPADLVGSDRISIQLESHHTGFYAYNWFYNTDANLHLIGSPESGPDPVTSPPDYSGYPYFFIKSVDRDESVTIKPYNFPPNQTFDVRMNWMNTRGIAGAVVETVTTDAKGALSETSFWIPGFLKGSDRIAIRLESPVSGYYAFNWFYNHDAH